MDFSTGNLDIGCCFDRRLEVLDGLEELSLSDDLGVELYHYSCVKISISSGKRSSCLQPIFGFMTIFGIFNSSSFLTSSLMRLVTLMSTVCLPISTRRKESPP
jgi:hypothetical protein